MKTPEIRIYFSWLLYDTVSAELDKLHPDDNSTLASKADCEEFAANYRAKWAKHESKILPALCDALGVEFYQAVINVPCAPYLPPISTPLIMSYHYSPDQFVDALTHELCHVLLTDNTVYSMESNEKPIKLDEHWRQLFGSELELKALFHVPVHALSKYIYVDVLQEPSRLKRDMEHVAHNAPYKSAWEYVNKHGYKEIIEQLKQDFVYIQKELTR